MKNLLVIKDLEQLKSISDPFRMKLLAMMSEEAKTGQMLADELELPRAKVHYHLSQLLKHGIITISHTAEKKSILQKFYIPSAKHIIADMNILNYNPLSEHSDPHVYQLKLNDYSFNALKEHLKNLNNEKNATDTASYLINIVKTEDNLI